MQGQNRRGFLQWVVGGLLSLVPASLLGQQVPETAARRAVPIDDDFSRVLRQTKTGNHVEILKAAKLTREEKIAIAAAREMGAKDLQTAAAKIRTGRDSASGGGGYCGGGCDGSGGAMCGLNCAGAIGKAQQVVDPQGLLKLNLRGIDRAAGLRALDRAIAAGKQGM